MCGLFGRPCMLARARTFTSESARARAFTRKTLLLRGAREREDFVTATSSRSLGPEREKERETHTQKHTHTHASTHSGLNHTEPDIFETAHIHV